MKKLLYSTLLTIILTANSVFASDVNKTMTDEEFMSQFMILDKRQKDAEAKTLQMQEKLEKIKKLRKTVDELGKQVGVD